MILLDVLHEANKVDTNAFFLINRMHCSFMDYFMSAYSGKLIWIPMYATVWFVMICNFHWRVTLLCLIGLVLTITIADQLGATAIRPFVERLRPARMENPIVRMVHIVDGYRGGGMDSLPVMLPIRLDWLFSFAFFFANNGSRCL